MQYMFAECPYGYQYYEGGLGCIRASTAAKTFDAADQECRAEGAVLARLPRLDAVSYFANFRSVHLSFLSLTLCSPSMLCSCSLAAMKVSTSTFYILHIFLLHSLPKLTLLDANAGQDSRTSG